YRFVSFSNPRPRPSARPSGSPESRTPSRSRRPATSLPGRRRHLPLRPPEPPTPPLPGRGRIRLSFLPCRHHLISLDSPPPPRSAATGAAPFLRSVKWSRRGALLWIPVRRRGTEPPRAPELVGGCIAASGRTTGSEACEHGPFVHDGQVWDDWGFVV
ncbi:hypothetical protein BRADI_1g61232v3, partial [Brachypodium distachyon]